MLKAGLSCLPRACKYLGLKLHFLNDACLLDKLLSKSMWHPGERSAVVLVCKAAALQRQRRAEGPWRSCVVQQPCIDLVFPPAFSLCDYAPRWFVNVMGSVLLSVCMLTLRNTGKHQAGAVQEA